MLQKYLMFDPEKCTGCKTCELSCSYRNFQKFSPHLSVVHNYGSFSSARFLTLTCFQCEQPLCAEACPRGAIINEKDGILSLLEDKCIKCKLCVMVCPFGGSSFVEGKILRCDLCEGEPACVNSCPTGALQYVNPAEYVKQKGRVVFKKQKQNYPADISG